MTKLLITFLLDYKKKKKKRIFQQKLFTVIYFIKYLCYLSFWEFPIFSFKACDRYFLSNFFSNQMIALQKLWKMLFTFYFIWKALFVLEIFRFLYFHLPLFFSLPVSQCFRGWWKINLKVCGVINCLNKNLITHFVCKGMTLKLCPLIEH